MNSEAFSVRIRTSWVSVITLLPWTLVAFAAVLFNIFGMISRPEMIEHTWGLLVILIFAATYGSNTLFWQLLGRYEFEVRDQLLQVDFKWNLFRRTKIIPISKIIHVEQATDKTTLWPERFWHSSGGKLEIRYFGGAIRLGQGYNPVELSEIEVVLNKLIGNNQT